MSESVTYQLGEVGAADFGFLRAYHLAGRLVRFAREDPNDFGSWYHGKIYVAAPAGEYEGAVDVSTPNGVPVEYREVRYRDADLFAATAALPDGWHPLDSTPASGALDYIRSPLLSSPSDWVDSTADNALDLLEQLLTGSRRVYVYGAPYDEGLGVHDIHYNQGDPPGEFQHLDAIWQDGGTIVEQPNGELIAFLTKFKPQVLTTNANGLPL